MGIKNKSHLILALLHTPDILEKENAPIEGITRLEKMIFLINKETKILSNLPKGDSFEFKPYKMGPFSSQIYDEVDFLEALQLIDSQKTSSDVSLGLIEEKLFFDDQILDKYQKNEPVDIEESKIYKLTSRGREVAKKIFDSLPKEDRDFLINLKKKFNHMNLKQFLRYVYKKYPEFTTESEIKEYLNL